MGVALQSEVEPPGGIQLNKKSAYKVVDMNCDGEVALKTNAYNTTCLPGRTDYTAKMQPPKGNECIVMHAPVAWVKYKPGEGRKGCVQWSARFPKEDYYGQCEHLALGLMRDYSFYITKEVYWEWHLMLRPADVRRMRRAWSS